MRHTILGLAIALMAVPFAANAADGKIHFEGSVVEPGCVVIAHSSPADIRVTLPPVASSVLAEAGRTAGRTPFFISIAGCNNTAKNAHTYFEPGPAVNVATNNLTLEAGAATARNVELQLLNENFSKIRLGNPAELQNSQAGTIVDGELSLRYYAEYVATGAASAGSANSSVMFTMTYP